MPGGTIRYVPLQPPQHGATTTASAADWTVDFNQLEKVFNTNTRMIVSTGISFRLFYGYLLTTGA